MASCFHTSKLALRIIEAIFALIAFSAAGWLLDVEASQTILLKHSTIAFMVFTGVMGFLLATLYAVSHCVPRLQTFLWGIVEVVINFLWVVFWLAAAAAFAAEPQCKPSSAFKGGQQCNAYLTAQAFAWLSFFLWCASLVLSVLDWRNGEGVGGAKRYPMGSAPRSGGGIQV